MAAPSINSSSPVSNFLSNSSVSQEILSLIDTSKWGSSGVGTGATVYYSFPTTNNSSLWSSAYVSNNSSEIYNNFTPLNTAQQAAAVAAFQQWSNVANINFISVDEESSSAVGDIRIANTSGGDMDAQTYAYAYLPALNNPLGGDVWFNTNQPTSSANDYTAGANGYQTMMHEIGHALGLDHPFDGTVLGTDKDHFQYTIMSYSDTAGSEDDGDATYYPTTPMLLDIQAIQYLYGANNDYNTGNNTYTFGDNHAYQTIWDAGGQDTIQYTGSLNSVINLNAGQFSSIGPSVKAHLGTANTVQNNVAIAYNVTIENAIGGSGNDTFYGNENTNLITGGAGTDTFIAAYTRSDVSTLIKTSTTQVALETSTQRDTLTDIESIQFSDQTLSFTNLFAQAKPEYNLSSNGNASKIAATTYSGPVSYLEYQYIGSNDGEVAVGSFTNDFINLAGNDDAIDGGSGQDIIDGGTGSNFLTGGADTDNFYLDGRGGEVTWSTITDFDGDIVNIWGWQDGVSQLLNSQDSSGAEGFKGATYHYDLDNNGVIDTSITFSGLSLAQAPTQSTGIIGEFGYILFSS